MSADFKRAMREFASGVTIVTTSEGGRPHGLTATAVMSITADPPTIAVCINRSATAHDPILRAGVFGVNVLGADSLELARIFASAARREERFADAGWIVKESRVPAYRAALAVLRCRLSERYALGTHSLLIGDVETVTVRHGMPPLIYVDGQFDTVARGSRPNQPRDSTRTPG